MENSCSVNVRKRVGRDAGRTAVWGIGLLVVILPVLAGRAFAATPGFDTLVNYDTAWTFVYDELKDTKGKLIIDNFYDVEPLPDGSSLCMGKSADSAGNQGFLLVKLSPAGKVVFNKVYSRILSSYNGAAITIAKNGDIVMGGNRFSNPWILCTDANGNEKWSTFVCDTTTGDPKPLSEYATINCIRESSRGTFICAAGNMFPDNFGSPYTDYLAYLEFDSLGKLINNKDWDNILGYYLGGFSIEETKGKNILIGGNRAVGYLDSTGRRDWVNNYGFQLDGVGSVENIVNKVKMLRGNQPIVIGRAYEKDCWTDYKKLYWDAWWSLIGYESGTSKDWYRAGGKRGDDNLYDCAQLKNGNIAFVGQLAGDQNRQTLWAFVTDSTGARMLWDYRQPMSAIKGAGPQFQAVSVCATEDDGFTVVGPGSSSTDAMAIAVHFVPKPVAPVTTLPKASPQTLKVHRLVTATECIFSIKSPIARPQQLSVFDAAGKLVSIIKKSGTTQQDNSIVWEYAHQSGGVYCYRLATTAGAVCGTLVVSK